MLDMIALIVTVIGTVASVLSLWLTIKQNKKP